MAHVPWNRDIAHFVVEYKPLFEATGAAWAPLQRAYGAVIDTEGTLSAAFIRFIRFFRHVVRHGHTRDMVLALVCRSTEDRGDTTHGEETRKQ